MEVKRMKRREREGRTESHTASERFAVFFCAIILSVSLSSFVSTVTKANPDPVVWVDSSDNNCWGNTPCENTVQGGINGVDSNGTVYIYEGEYNEDTILIDRSVSLIGLNGSEVTMVGNASIMTGHTMQIDENLFVNISGLMIRNIFNGVRRGINSSANTALRVSDCIFQNLYVGIYVTEGYLFAESNFFNVTATIPAYQPNAIFVYGGSTSSIVVNNAFKYTKNGLAVRIHETAIQLIANNTFNQGSIGSDPAYGDRSGNIGLSNMGLTDGYTVVRNNTMTNGYWGVMSEGTNATVENNTMTGCRICISSTVYTNTENETLKYPSDLTVSNNTITSFIGYGLQVANKWSYMKAVNNSIAGQGLSSGQGVRVENQGRLDFGPNNTVSNAHLGVKTYYDTFTNASQNTIFNTSEGFHSEGKDNIRDNTFHSNGEGIRLQGNPAYGTREIVNNTIEGSYATAGIWVWDSSSNDKIQDNNISQGYRGVLISGASSGNVVEMNNISNNVYGIHIEPHAYESPVSNTLRSNNISFSDYGIYVDQSDGTTIEDNDIYNSIDAGIHLSDSDYTNVTRGNMTNNYIGIDVHSSSNTVVTDNSILGNVLWAISTTDYVNASGNYFGTVDLTRIDRLVSENVNYSDPLAYRESGVNITNETLILTVDTEFPRGRIVNGSLYVGPNVKITFTNQSGNNFIQVNGILATITDSSFEATHGNFTLLMTNGSASSLLGSRFERQLGVGIQTASVNVENCEFVNGTAGVVVNQGTSNTIRDSDFLRNSRYGVYLFGSSGNVIQDNLMALSRNGIEAYNSTLDSLSWNNISANELGIKVTHSSGASVHNNTIANNHIGAEIQGSWYTTMNNNSIVGNVRLAITGSMAFGTNVQYNYFGTNDSAQIEKLCQGVDCSLPKDHWNPIFDYVDGSVTWSTPQSLTKGVIVNGNLTINNTQVNFSSPDFHNFIQVNGLLSIKTSQLQGNEDVFTLLYLNKSSGTITNSTLDVFHGVGVQSEFSFVSSNTTFTNGTYGVEFWKSKLSEINNSTFEGNEEWSVGLFHSNQNVIETSGMFNSSIGIYVYSSRWNTLQSNEITDNPIGIWLDSRPLSVRNPEVYPEGNDIFSNEFYNNDVGILVSYSENNTVASNVFSSNGSGTGAELSGMYAKNMNLSSNTFRDNERGVHIYESTRNKVDDNTFTDNIYSIDVESSRHVWVPYPPTGTNNVITRNNISIDWGYTYGIRVQNSELNFLGDNIISSSSGWAGIWIEESDNNTFANNSISSNSAAKSTNGIHLENAGGNNLTNNTITNFTYNFGIVGVKLWDFVQEIDSQNSVDSKPIYYWVHENGNNSSYSSDGGYYGFVNSTYMKVGNVSEIQHNLQAFLIAFSNHIDLTNVSASNTSYGVESYMSHRNVIANSTFFHNHHAIYLGHSNYSTISNVSSRENYGIEPRTGVYLYKSYHNLITNNTTVSSNRPGIRLDYSFYNTISYCNLTNNVVGGIVIAYGGNNNVSRCTMSRNENGVYIMGSPWNNITNSSIDNSTVGGIRIEVAFSDNNLIANNDITNNSDYGILMKAPSGITNNRVILNNITSNGGYAVKIEGNNGGNWIHHNNMICNRGDCNNSYQGSDSFVAGSPSNQWDNTTVGNHWNYDSWKLNGGFTETPKTYWVTYDEGPIIKDNFPQNTTFIQAGPQ